MLCVCVVCCGERTTESESFYVSGAAPSIPQLCISLAVGALLESPIIKLEVFFFFFFLEVCFWFSLDRGAGKKSLIYVLCGWVIN